MNARDLANTFIKMLGVYWLAHAVVYIMRGSLMPFSGLESVVGFNWKVEMFSVMFIGFYFGIVGYFLTFKTSTIMRIINIETQPINNITSTSTDKNYARLAFSLLGTFFAVPAFTRMLSDLISIWIRSKSTIDYRFFEEPTIVKNFPDLAENIIKLLIGIALIFGSERLSQLWKRLRPLSENDDQSQS